MSSTGNHSASIDEGPWRITFDTNPDQCNLHCIMCEDHSLLKKNEKKKRPSMDIEIIRSVVQQMVALGLTEIIPSTMGEPLLYEHMEEIIEIAREQNVRVNLTTNGTWPRIGSKEWANKLCPVCSDIKISWNGVDPEVHESIMVGSSYRTKLENLGIFVNERNIIASNGGNYCRLTLQVTFMESNLDELPKIVRLASKMGIERVKGHHLWVHYPELQSQDMRRSLDSRTRWNEAVKACKETADNFRLPDGNRILLENFDPLPLNDEETLPGEWMCPFIGKEAWVNHSGRFDPCCAPDEERKKLGSFGNVTDCGGLEAIWKGDLYRELMENYSQNEICRKCNMRRPVGRKINA